jgi:hypothetical protein
MGCQDGLFILQDFYKAILKLFADEEDEWVIDTLAWWNEYVICLFFLSFALISQLDRQIFPDKLSTKNNSKDRCSNVDPNSAQLKAKCARLERAEKRRQVADV